MTHNDGNLTLLEKVFLIDAVGFEEIREFLLVLLRITCKLMSTQMMSKLLAITSTVFQYCKYMYSISILYNIVQHVQYFSISVFQSFIFVMFFLQFSVIEVLTKDVVEPYSQFFEQIIESSHRQILSSPTFFLTASSHLITQSLASRSSSAGSQHRLPSPNAAAEFA